MLLLFAAEAYAGKKVLIGTPVASAAGSKPEKEWYYPFEIAELKIRQSNAGTGIIKDVTCPGCDYRFVKITANTSVIVNGEKVDRLSARERAGKPAYIEFDRDTAEVKFLYWAE